MKYNVEEFYPTPESVYDKLVKGIDWNKVFTVLEPSAGKGNMVEYLQRSAKCHYRTHDFAVDCIEIDDELRATLKGKEFKDVEVRVVHDDFLTFNTFKKYNLILMNPPFSNGATHLLKALEMQKDGGAVACVLNAETIRNPYTNERKVLVQKLEELNADISYLQNAFVSSEHPTGVEVAIIRVFIEEKTKESLFYEELKTKYYQENTYSEMTELAPNDFVESIVAMYNREVEAGVNLIQEYKALSPYILSSFKESSYNKPILNLKVGDKDLSVNRYVKCVREKYWEALFKNPKFTGNMTSNLAKEYSSQVRELTNYDFSYYNIKTIQEEMSRNLIRGIEECIIKLFDDLTYQHSWYPECSKNIHYFNGWATNKAWYINKKVVLPNVSAFSTYSGSFQPDYYVKEKLMDIERALNYLDGGRTDGRDMDMWLRHAVENKQTKNIELKYFFVTFYKKGTAHITFKDEELLKKLNIFGCQQKKWLPPAYGKKKYSQMTPEEQKVIKEFDGSEVAYTKVLSQSEYYIYEPKNSIPCIESISA